MELLERLMQDKGGPPASCEGSGRDPHAPFPPPKVPSRWGE